MNWLIHRLECVQCWTMRMCVGQFHDELPQWHLASASIAKLKSELCRLTAEWNPCGHQIIAAASMNYYRSNSLLKGHGPPCIGREKEQNRTRAFGAQNRVCSQQNDDEAKPNAMFAHRNLPIHKTTTTSLVGTKATNIKHPTNALFMYR